LGQATHELFRSKASQSSRSISSESSTSSRPRLDPAWSIPPSSHSTTATTSIAGVNARCRSSWRGCTTRSTRRYYIDPKTARIVGSYNSSAWVSRWLYNGLHSLNFPWLYNYRPLWDIVVITFMVGGTALCVTSLILAWRVLGRKLRGAAPSASRDTISDDLALAD
jgi:hypothetical protein